MSNNIQQIPLFENLNQQEIKIIADFLISKEYKSGAYVFKEGDLRDKLIIIINGLVALKIKINDKLETIALFKDNNFIGEMSFIKKGTKHKETLEVVSPLLDTLELSVYNWFTIQKKYPTLANKIYKNILLTVKNRLDHTNNKLVTLFATGKIVATHDSIKKISEYVLKAILKIIPSEKAIFLTYLPDIGKIHIEKNINYKNIKDNIYLNIKEDILLSSLINNPQTKIVNKNNITPEYTNLKYICNSLIIIPLKINKLVLGFIILGNKKNKREYSLNNKILLEAIASQIAPFIEKRQKENVEKGSHYIEREYIESLT